MGGNLSHIGPDGRARMVDVSAKGESVREAIACGRLRMAPETLQVAQSGGTEKKGDPLGVAELAGIMAAKRTGDLIPRCHPLALSGVSVSIEADPDASCLVATARVKTTAATGVEMEALTAASVACLTLYDMLKSVDKAMLIERVELLEKTGGKSGDYRKAP